MAYNTIPIANGTRWSAADFEDALAELKNDTRQQDQHLPDMADVLTEALDALFGDYINLKSLPKNDLDWVGTHLWKDVAVLQGPASQTQSNIPRLHQSSVENCNLVNIAETLADASRPSLLAANPVEAASRQSLLSLPKREFAVRPSWDRNSMADEFLEHRVQWPQYAEYIMDGSWYRHDNPNSKYQSVFRATAAPSYVPQLAQPSMSWMEAMRTKRLREGLSDEPQPVPSFAASSSTRKDPPPAMTVSTQMMSAPSSLLPRSAGSIRSIDSSSGMESRDFSQSEDDEHRCQKRREASGGRPCDDSVLKSRAAERRSREKLKNSLQELILAVPGLAGAQTSKATAVSKAVQHLYALRRRNEELSAMVEALSNSVHSDAVAAGEKGLPLAEQVTVEIVSNEYKFMFVDAAWERVMGYAAPDVMGKATHDFFSCTTCALIEAISLNIKERLEAGLDWKGVMLCRRKDGEFLVPRYVAESPLYLFECRLQRAGGICTADDEENNFTHYICTRKNFTIVGVKAKGEVCALKGEEQARKILDVRLSADEA